MSSSTTTKVTTVRDKLNSPTLGKAADVADRVPLGDILSVLLDSANSATTVAATTVGTAITPTASAAAVPTTATSVSATSAVSPASAAYASPDQSTLAALANATKATVNQCVVDIGALTTKLNQATVDIGTLATQVNAAIVDIKALRANAAAAFASIHGGATDASLSVGTYTTATLTARASSVISVRSSAGGTTGVLKLVRDSNHTLVTGEVFWDGTTGLKFCAADTITTVDVIYSKYDGSQKVSCLLPTVSP